MSPRVVYVYRLWTSIPYYIGAEREWLKCGDKDAKMEKKREYVEKRRTSKKAVGKAKRGAEESRQNELEGLIRSPRRW